MNEILGALKADDFRIGNCQVIPYDRTRLDLFPPDYLFKLWKLCQTSGHRTKQGILPRLFCGMSDLSAPAIVSYLANRLVLVLGVWTSPGAFTEAGMLFPTALPIMGNSEGPERAMFAGYGFFKDFWGMPELEVLGMLGLAYFFFTLSLSAIHGVGYASNGISANFMRRFGFKDIGRIPRYLLWNGRLVDALAMSLSLEDFTAFTEAKLVELLNKGELGNGKEFGGRTGS